MSWLTRLFGGRADKCQSCGGQFERSSPVASRVGTCASCGKLLCGRCVRTSHNGGAYTHHCPMCGRSSGPDTTRPPR